jgi:hypothetical protein
MSNTLKQSQEALEARKQLVGQAELRLLECAMRTKEHGPSCTRSRR